MVSDTLFMVYNFLMKTFSVVALGTGIVLGVCAIRIMLLYIKKNR